MTSHEIERSGYMLREARISALAGLDALAKKAEDKRAENPLNGAIANLRLTDQFIVPLVEDFFNLTGKSLKFGLFAGILYPPIIYHSREFPNELFYIPSREEDPYIVTEHVLRELFEGRAISTVESISVSQREYIGKFRSHIAAKFK